MISPFCIQQNYEGQLDETFGIESCYVKIENKILNPSQEPAEKKNAPDEINLKLNNEDMIFKEVRNISVSALGGVTTRKLNEIQTMLNRKDEKMSIKQMTTYMAEIKELNIAKSK